MASHNASSNDHGSSGGHHVISLETYLKVFAALIFFTFLTVGADLFFDNIAPAGLAWLGTPVAFLIATTKAILVMAIFMHLKYDSNINRVVFGAAFFFVFLLFLFSALDVFTRAPVTSSLWGG